MHFVRFYLTLRCKNHLTKWIFKRGHMKRIIIWIAALVVGVLLGLIQNDVLNDVINFIATVYTRLFQLLSVPIIVLAVITTLASFGNQKSTGRIFTRTLIYTLLTTLMAAIVGAVLYWIIAPGNLPIESIAKGNETVTEAQAFSYYDHILSVIPNNIVRPFLEGNVLSLLLIAFAVGIGLSRLPESEPKQIIVKGLTGLQELLFLLIRGLIWTLPLGILAFSAQLTTQISSGVAIQSLGKYVAVILGGNLIQFFIVLPLFLLLRGINPIRILSQMAPAVLMALFTKSSAATLPVTIETAEERVGIQKHISRFVLPICTTINMNGCAAFILVTSLFVMQHGSAPITFATVCLWVVISVISAIGNAGVPMGCFFLTLSLLSGVGAPIELMGLILPIYAIIDMVETAENVWSDSCVCSMVNKDFRDNQ